MEHPWPADGVAVGDDVEDVVGVVGVGVVDTHAPGYWPLWLVEGSVTD